jgi:hypothetical protein
MCGLARRGRESDGRVCYQIIYELDEKSVSFRNLAVFRVAGAISQSSRSGVVAGRGTDTTPKPIQAGTSPSPVFDETDPARSDRASSLQAGVFFRSTRRTYTLPETSENV